MECLPTPRQLHHFVGDLFALGSNLQCVRPIHNKFGAGRHAWTLLFPVIAFSQDEESDSSTHYVSTQVRIGRLGYTHWSLRVVNSADEVDKIRSSPMSVITKADGHADMRASFEALRIKSKRYRTISKFIWSSSGITTANTTSRIITDDGLIHWEANVPKDKMPDLHNPLLTEPDEAQLVTASDVTEMRDTLHDRYADALPVDYPLYSLRVCEAAKSARLVAA